MKKKLKKDDNKIKKEKCDNLDDYEKEQLKKLKRGKACDKAMIK